MFDGNLSPSDFYSGMAQFFPEFISHADAMGEMDNGRQPSRESRETFSSIEDSKRKLDGTIEDEEYVYVDIPEEIVNGGRHVPKTAWLMATPKSVQETILEISRCWREAKEQGYVPGQGPTEMDDIQIEHAIRQINIELSAQFVGWGYQAGFNDSPSFDLKALSIESKRAIIGRVQRVMHRVNLHVKLRGQNESNPA